MSPMQFYKRSFVDKFIVKKPLFAAGLLLVFTLFGLSIYSLEMQQSKSYSKAFRKTTTPSPVVKSQDLSSIVETKPSIIQEQPSEPKLVAFMRDGEIWVKDYQTNIENKISSSSKVALPKFSPDARYLTYFEIMHAPGGFPRYSLYVSDKDGQYERTFDMGANHFASKLKWSSEGSLLGLVLFANELPGDNYKEEAYIYDALARKEILIGRLADRQMANSYEYFVDSSCKELETAYVSFCNEYVSYIGENTESDYTGDYKRDEFLQSQYTKQDYKLSRSEKLDNGLVVLEYYTGKAQNPEASWGILGGVFYPGYDDGVTETYTVLLNESTGEVIDEIYKAVDSDFYF